MPSLPLVSVITPVWGRHRLLLDRCIPSVREQTYAATEHIIVSDGPDPVLARYLAPDGPDGNRDCWFHELAAHDPAPHYGHLGRLAGIGLAHGDLITYCDSDDALRPGHCALLAEALRSTPSAGFAVSRMVSHNGSAEGVIGWGPVGFCNIGTPMIMHRREILEHGTWGPASQFEDWELVERWLGAGITYVSVDAETSDVWPSLFRAGDDG